MTDTTKKLVSYRLEPELVEALKARAKAEKKDQTEIVELALQMYLDLPIAGVASPVVDVQLADIQKRLEAQLEDRLASALDPIQKELASLKAERKQHDLVEQLAEVGEARVVGKK